MQREDHSANLVSSPHSYIRTQVNSLSLFRFRNYATASLQTDGGSVVLTGVNGAGKTNLLEAISLLTPGRGLRRAALADIEKIDNDEKAGLAYAWAVAADVSGPTGDVAIGTGRDENDAGGDRRVIKIDGKISRGQSELARVFSALWVTPQMDNLFIEGGSARRKFLDRLVFSFDAEHATRVNAYDFAMRERNRLLQNPRSDNAWLSALEHKMAEQGVAIAVARGLAVEGLNNAIGLSTHSFPQARLALAGTVDDALGGGFALSAEESFQDVLERNRGEDARSGRCLTGVHRTVVKVTHIEKNMPAERCSTGEQKALLLSIILAQARAGSAWHGYVPVLLLDEVVSHLDGVRRAELFAELHSMGVQAWLTGTDLDNFSDFNAKFVHVDDGRLL